MRFLHLLLILIISYASAGSNDRYLVTPNPEKCKARFKEFQFNGRNYFYSGHDKELKDQKTDWLDSRNTCRERCMETVSFETQDEFDFIKKYIADNNIKFIWTSGRLCDFAGCEGRWDLLPKIIKGWLWSANQIQIDDTDKIPKGWNYTPWSQTGHLKRKQPDNAEFYVNQATESCLGILNNQYNDSVAWHDIACYHKTGFICEDSPDLLSEAQEIKSHSENREEVVEVAPQKAITDPRPTTTSVPRTTTERNAASLVTKGVKITTEKKTTAPAKTSSIKTTAERKFSQTSTTAEENTTTLAPATTSEASEALKFRTRRTRTRVTPPAVTLEEKITKSTTEEPTTTKEEILDKAAEEVPVVLSNLEDEPEIVVKVEEEPVIVAKTEEVETTAIEELTTIATTKIEEPKVSIKQIFTKRKKIFGKIKTQPSTEEPETFSSKAEQLPSEPAVKKNFRKLVTRTTTTQAPDAISSAEPQLPSEPSVRKTFRKLVTRLTTAAPIISTENLPDPLRPKKIFGKLKVRTTTTEEPVTASSAVEQIPEEPSESLTESSIPKSSDDSIELQKIDEPVQETTTTTEEPESEERRAIPIKRKKVKLYRKVFKTTTEAYFTNDGPSQSIDNIDEISQGPPIPIRRKFFQKPKFRPLLNQS